MANGNGNTWKIVLTAVGIMLTVVLLTFTVTSATAMTRVSDLERRVTEGEIREARMEATMEAIKERVDDIWETLKKK